MTIEQIKEDLKEIRFYYSKQREFDGAAKIVGKCGAAEKAEKYNAVICNAPAILYSLYVSLYVNNNTQLVVALDWDCSADHIKRLNSRLCAFFKKQFEIAD